MGLILDSTVLIAGERSGLTVPAVLENVRKLFGDQSVAIAAMTAAELVHGIWRADKARTRAIREEFVEEVFERLAVQPMTLRTARIFGRIDAELRARGVVVPTADLLIGATALELGYGVATANARRYQMIRELNVHVLRPTAGS